jgi:cell filamentation protein
MKYTSGFSKYDGKDITQSVYCYKGSDVLVNKENIRDAKALMEYEADMTMIRQYQLENDQPVKGKFGISH